MSGTYKTTVSSDLSFTINDVRPPPILAIHSAPNHMLVTLHPDGTLEYGEGYTPDAAARIFWESLACYMPVPLRVDKAIAEKVLHEFTRICVNEHHDDAPREHRIEAMQRALTAAFTDKGPAV